MCVGFDAMNCVMCFIVCVVYMHNYCVAMCRIEVVCDWHPRA